MRFEVSRSVLLDAIQSVSSAAATKSSFPIVQNILIQLTENQLRMTATNLEIELSCVVDCGGSCINVIESGSLTVPARKFLDVVRAFPEAIIKLELKDGKLVLKCGRSRFTLAILPAEDFPQYRAMDEARTLKVAEQSFKNALKAVLHSVANNDVRYYLNGVHLDFNPAYGLNVVATDGHRLALENLPIEVNEEWSTIIPASTVEKMLKLMDGDSDEAVSFQYTSDSMALSKDGVTLKSKFIDGKFPDYARVIPRESSSSLMIHREEWINSIRRAQCVMSAKSDGLAFEFCQDVLMISCKNAEQEQAEEVIDLQSSSGLESSLLIGFNGKYLVDALNSMDTELVKVGLNGVNSGFIEPTEGSGKRVIMPMRL